MTIPATIASAERFFSKLKLVKNYLRCAKSPTRLVDLERLNIESSIARQVDFDSVIRNFAKKNTRKSRSLMIFFKFFPRLDFTIKAKKSCLKTGNMVTFLEYRYVLT